MAQDKLKHLLDLKNASQAKDPNKELQKDLVRKQNEIEALRSSISSPGKTDHLTDHPEMRRSLVLAQIKWHSDQVALHNKSLVALQEELSSL
jgi:hypothetical protein